MKSSQTEHTHTALCVLSLYLCSSWPITRPTLQTPNEHKQNTKKWWLDLAEDDDAREKLLHILSEERVLWSGHARIAIGRAMEDIKRYHYDPDRSTLLPSKKKSVMVEGSSVTKDDVMIQKIKDVEDEIELVEE